jgi:hypothetical protein
VKGHNFRISKGSKDTEAFQCCMDHNNPRNKEELDIHFIILQNIKQISLVDRSFKMNFRNFFLQEVSKFTYNPQ